MMTGAPIFFGLLLCCFSSSSYCWFLGSSSSGSSGGGSSGRRSHAFDHGNTRTLLGSRVVSAQPFNRPLEGFPDNTPRTPFTTHSGVVVKTDRPVGGHSRFLIHKAKAEQGTGGRTVVTPATDMSARWEPMGPTRTPSKPVRVTDLVAAGGREYNLATNNCHHARGKVETRAGTRERKKRNCGRKKRAITEAEKFLHQLFQ